jgi:NADH dehydrogenase
MIVALGERRGIGEIRGRHVSGLSAWLLWRGFYLARLPTGGRRVRVALDWLLSAAGGPALVELPLYSRVAPGEQRATERAAVPR